MLHRRWLPAACLATGGGCTIGAEPDRGGIRRVAGAAVDRALHDGRDRIPADPPRPTFGRRVPGLSQGRDVDGGAQFPCVGAPHAWARPQSCARYSIAAPIPAAALNATTTSG